MNVYILSDEFKKSSLKEVKEFLKKKYNWEENAFEVANMTFSDGSNLLVLDPPSDLTEEEYTETKKKESYEKDIGYE